MKSIALVATIVGLALSSVASAANIKVAHIAQPITVEKVEASVTGRGVHNVIVTATFSNSCFVPKSEELVIVYTATDSYDTLALNLGLIPEARVCTMEYSPVTVTIDVGGFTTPNDAPFSSITVNGVEAL